MVSGWDKNPPDRSDPYHYEPDIGWGGRLILILVVAFVFLAAGGGYFLS